MAITRDEQLKSPLRHDFGRKLDSFEDADVMDRPLTMAEWNSLSHIHQTFDTENNEIADFRDPFDDSINPKKDFLFFLHMLNGKVYLVNSEGYTYCRYIIEAVRPVEIGAI